MLRGAVLLLVLANGLSWAYGQGWLDFLGLSVGELREPERLQQQIHADQLHLLNAPAPVPLPSPVPAPEVAPVGAQAPTGSAVEKPEPPPTVDSHQGSSSSAPAVPAPAAVPEPVPAPVPPVPVKAVAQAKATLACWQVGGYTATQTIALNAAMQAQPTLQAHAKTGKRWSIEETVVVGGSKVQRRYTLHLPAISEAEREQIESLKALAGKALQPCP